jgi:hypothetical protein
METLDSFDAVLRQFAEKLERRTISIELVNQETHFATLIGQKSSITRTGAKVAIITLHHVRGIDRRL